jgi:tungstate transport system ATP-binding protein
VKQFELENLVFRRGAGFKLEIDAFSLDQGEKLAVVGPNGSGKTTLLRLLSFLERPDSWSRFLYRGRPYTPGKMDRRGLGVLKQQPLLFRGSVAQNLTYPLKMQRLTSEEIGGRVDSMLALMELDHLRNARAHRLSVGEQRRLALGRALIAGQETLLLDEPVVHLDLRSRTVIEDVLAGAHQTILMTTHDLHFAHRVAHRVLSLREGRLSTGLPVNLFRGLIRGGRLETGHGLSISLPERPSPIREGSAAVTLDPRRLAVSREPPGSATPNLLRGYVSSIREQGIDVWLEIDCGHRLTAIISRTTYEEEGLNLHQEVVVSFGPDAVECS